MPVPQDGPGRAEAPAGKQAPFAARFIATGAFCGYVPRAQGTAGSAAGLLLYLLPGVSSSYVLAVLVAAGFFAGRWAADLVARETGHALSASAAAAKRLFQPGGPLHPDPSIVVIDEIVGMWTALLFLPKEPAAMIVAFVTFRAFDIIKPPPCNSLEKLGNGWGIMLDDLAAGIYAGAATWLTLRIIG